MLKLTHRRAWDFLYDSCDNKPLGAYQDLILNLVVECSDASVDEVNVATGLAFKELGENKKVVNFARMLFTA